jgi:putative flavoprotein involved in K+ transport
LAAEPSEVRSAQEHDVQVIDCVVVGGGPAGLATSVALDGRGVDHVVLERDRVGATWRDQRWDSFRLNTAGWMNPMLGGQERYAYAPVSEIVERLERVAGGCPVREGVRVERLAPAGDGWVLATGDGELRAHTVVVATGDQNVPRFPALAARFPERVVQLHAATYRGPAQLPEGAVLVVGTAQSGCQIAEDLLAGGRRVVLATSAVGRLPFRYRGRDILEWLIDVGFMDQRPQDLPDPAVMKATMPIIAPGHGLSLPGLARAGATLAGRPVAVDGERVSFDDSVAANVAAGDAFAARARTMADELVRRQGLDAPPGEPDEHDHPVDLDPPATIDLRAAEVGAVVWCTGFSGDFSWLDPALTGPDGLPRHRQGTAPAPGLWYLGLRWMRRRGSSILYGFPGDAAWVAGEVGTHLGG